MRALIVIPPITDFAAHDMWASPYGAMVIASAFKRHNMDFDLIDFLGRDYVTKEYRDGRRRYKRTVIELPEPLKGRSIKRHFAIYGADLMDIEREIESAHPHYDLIIITTTMTYWYYGYRLVYERLKRRFPDSVYIVGGVYPSLLYEHSRSIFAGAYIIPNSNLPLFDRIVSELSSKDFTCFSAPFLQWELPDVDSFIYRRYIPVLLTRGCPFRCTYCASRRLVERMENRDPVIFADKIVEMSAKTGIKDIALFDDAFLFDISRLAKPFLKRIVEHGSELRIHASNGLHPRFIDSEVAYLMRASGFSTIRLSLESSNETIMEETGGKVRRSEYETAVRLLMQNGYKREDLGTYVICGLPSQMPQDVLDSVHYVSDSGGVCYLAEFSPIPDTDLFYEAQKISRIDLSEPLWQNNTLMAYWHPYFSEDILNGIKMEVIRLRGKVDSVGKNAESRRPDSNR